MLNFEKNTAVRHLMHLIDITFILNIINLKLEKKCRVFLFVFFLFEEPVSCGYVHQ